MPAPDAVTNAGPLIYLAAFNRFHLLKGLLGEVYLPEAVYEEVVAKGRGQPGADETRRAVDNGWLQLASVQDRIAVDALLDTLDLGEAEAIVLARELGVGRALRDDRAARNKARLMGLQVTGTIGILLLAREAGADVDIKRNLDVRVQHGFRMSRDLYETIVERERG